MDGPWEFVRADLLPASFAKVPVKCQVPKVTGLKLAKAKTRIRKRHCRVGKITKKFSAQAKKGRVVRQLPKGSSRKRKNGFRVNLTVGKGLRGH